MLSIDKFLEYLRSELNRSQRTVENYREDLKLSLGNLLILI